MAINLIPPRRQYNLFMPEFSLALSLRQLRSLSDVAITFCFAGPALTKSGQSIHASPP